MTTRAVGLKSFNEAFDEALAEEEAAASETPAPASAEPESKNVVEDSEQPTVETEEKVGLFTDLESEEAGGEQPSEKDSHTVTVRGETFEVSTQELINGYQRQADYTRDKQELTKLEEEHNKAITLWEALENDYVGTVQKLMSRGGLKGQVQPGPKAPEEDIDALVEQKLQQKLADDPRLQQFEQERALRELNVIFSEIEQEYDLPPLTDPDKQLILEKAQEWETTDLAYVTWRLLQMKQQKDAQRENAELVSTVKGRRGGSQEDAITQPEYYSTVSAAWEAALAEEEGLTP